MYALRCRTKEKYPDVPYFLMGHSMGSFLTRTYLIRYPGTVDAAIIMGTGHQSPAIVAGGRAIAKAAGKRHGFKAHYEAFRRAGARDVELKLYKGLRHEILNEDCRAVVYNDLWSWIEKHL